MDKYEVIKFKDNEFEIDVRVSPYENTVWLTQKQMAETIGISEKTFNLRMKSGIFGTDEVEKIIEVLHIKNPMDIFFAKRVTW